jgi:hypothetical protein
MLRLLERWPTSQALRAAPRQELLAFALASKHGWPERLADQVATALAAHHFTPRAYLVRAKADTIRLAATQLLAIGAQRRVWERRMASCCLALHALGEPSNRARNGRGARSLAARST